MPSISTMVYPSPAYVRVEVNWADVGAATGAAVYRVDCLTGERVPLRPYVSFDGDFLDLSCGYAIFWDTEPQLDRCIYYCTQAQDGAGNLITTAPAVSYQDTFDRTVVDGWGVANTGQSYQLLGGTVPGDYDVTASRGTFTLTTNNVGRESIVLGLNQANGFLYGFYQHPVVPTGVGNHEIGIRARHVDSNNFCDLRIFLSPANTVQLAVRQVVGGVESFVAFSGLITNAGGANVAANDPLNYRLDFWGSILRAKVWLATEPEPAAYSVSTTITHLAAGSVAYLGDTPAGSTNVLPLILKFDSHLLVDPCATNPVVEVCSQDLVAPSSGDFRLGDPVRPCDDVTLLFEAPIDPDCVPTQGIFFGNMADEVFPASSGTLIPVNSRYPLAINRVRQAVTSTLTVASKTFPDRDAMRTLNEPGSPLLLRGPAKYGINDRYMAVGDVSESRPVSDHKVTPRVIVMPHAEVARPSGPSQGVCGTRVQDLCDIYTTWDALAAAGLTWADLLRGKASHDTPIPDTVERTWADVNSTYANWTAVNSGNTDWDDLRDGA